MTAAVLSGCGSNADKADTAVIVDGTEVPLDAVQEDVRWLADNVPDLVQRPGQQPDPAEQQQAQRQMSFADLSRRQVETRIHHELVRRAAEREGLQADPADVNALIEQIGGLDQVPQTFGVTRDRARELIVDFVLTSELARKYIDRVEVDVVGGVVTEEEPGSTARDKARQLAKRIQADPDNAKDLATEVSGEVLDESLALSDVMESEYAALAITPVFTAEEGAVVVAQPSQQQGSAWMVVLIDERRITEPSGEPQPVDQNPQVEYMLGQQQLATVADTVDIEVNPRFGIWDPTSLSVVAGEEDITGELLPPRQQQ